MGILKRLVALAAMMLVAAPAVAQSTLETVKKRGELVCGVDGTLPGFSLYNAVKEWEGLDVDLCRAIAAAVLGNANKVKFVSVSAKDRFDDLVAGKFDVLARNSTVTSPRAGCRSSRSRSIRRRRPTTPSMPAVAPR